MSELTESSQEHLARLIQAVDTADSATLLVDAVQNLADSGLEGAIPSLIKTLGYNNPGAAVAAVDGLIKMGEPAVPALLDQLDQHNYTARAWAIRALAGIGDPRGLVTLLGAATADFALSVRRAAAKGLGTMKWHWFPKDLLEIAQEEALESLLFVVQQDDEWIVRYAAVVGLQALAGAITNYPEWRSQIDQQFEQLTTQDDSWAVRARACEAQRQLKLGITPPSSAPEQPASLQSHDWRSVLAKLYERKGHERLVLSEGDPRRYRNLVEAVAPKVEN
jgi:phycocyanobilin lyase subunit beta